MPFNNPQRVPGADACLSRLPEFLRDCGWQVPTRLQSQWTSVDGLRLHSRRSAVSADIPFVLVHGLVISSLYMIPLAECLAVEHEVHALDLPGFGKSQGPPIAMTIVELSDALLQWLTARGIVCCHLVANSMGCQVAAHLAASHPEYVASLVLMGATVDPAARRPFTQFLRLAQDALREPPRLWLSWLFDFARAGLRRTLATVRAMFVDRIENELPFITAPTLLLRGENDPTMPERWTRQAAALLPDAKVIVIAGKAHCAHYSAPAEVAQAIIAHTAGVGCAPSA